MAIYDNNGTANTENGKVYDNNGTTNSQIGKVYDNNGTTNSLLYSAVEPITIIPDATNYPASKYTKIYRNTSNVNNPEGHSNGYYNTAVSYSGNALYVFTRNFAQCLSGVYIPITIDGHKHFTVTGYTQDPSDDVQSLIKVVPAVTYSNIVNGIGYAYSHPDDSAGVTISGTYDISSLGDGTAYLFIGTKALSAGQSLRACKTYITGFTLTE